jgi:hypothetical protein
MGSDAADTLFAWRRKPASVVANDDTAIPAARADFAAAGITMVDPLDNTTFALFFASGGRNHYAISFDATPMADTWVYSMNHFMWVQAQQVNAPEPRMAHSCVTVDLPRSTDTIVTPKSSVIIFGGVQGTLGEYGTELSNELWRCNVSSEIASGGEGGIAVTAVWEELPASTMGPSPRAWHTAVGLGQFMVVFGGRLSVDKMLNATNSVSPCARARMLECSPDVYSE